MNEPFRRAMGRVPTGVSVITALGPHGPIGMTVGSLTHVSSEPPMVAFFAQRNSARASAVIEAGVFGVSVLTRRQVAECYRFASHQDAGFAGIDTDESPSGIPRIRGCLLWLEARVSSIVDAGDHFGVFAEVHSFEAPTRHDQALSFYRSKPVSMSPASGRHLPTEALQWW